jgi:SWIM zinc finger
MTQRTINFGVVEKEQSNNYLALEKGHIHCSHKLFGTCDCQKPQLTGIPCSHVIAVCQHRNFDVYGFIDERYNTAHLLNTWSGQFHCYGDQ